MTPISEIIAAGSRFYDLPENIMKGPCRERHIAQRRFSIMAACRGNGYTLQEIGRALNRDHGSIMHGIEQCCPEAFGELWPTHQRYMTLMGCSNVVPEAYEQAARDSIGKKIAEIRLQIDILNNSLNKLTLAHQQLQ